MKEFQEQDGRKEERTPKRSCYVSGSTVTEESERSARQSHAKSGTKIIISAKLGNGKRCSLSSSANPRHSCQSYSIEFEPAWSCARLTQFCPIRYFASQWLPTEAQSCPTPSLNRPIVPLPFPVAHVTFFTNPSSYSRSAS